MPLMHRILENSRAEELEAEYAIITWTRACNSLHLLDIQLSHSGEAFVGSYQVYSAVVGL